MTTFPSKRYWMRAGYAQDATHLGHAQVLTCGRVVRSAVSSGDTAAHPRGCEKHNS